MRKMGVFNRNRVRNPWPWPVKDVFTSFSRGAWESSLIILLYFLDPQPAGLGMTCRIAMDKKGLNGWGKCGII